MYLSKPISIKKVTQEETKQQKRQIADNFYDFLYTMDSDNLDFDQYEKSLTSKANIR